MGYRTVADIFSQISGVYDRFLSLATLGRIHSWQRDLVKDMGKGGNWLDVGTGTGEVLLKLGEDYEGLKVGLDPAEGMVFSAKVKCAKCGFVIAVAEDLPFKEGTFSRISLSLVFRHLQDQNRFLREAGRVLKDEGVLGIIDIGRFRGTGAVLLLMRTVLRPLGTLVFGREKWEFFIRSVEESYTVGEVVSLLEKNGFRVLKVRRRMLGTVFIITARKTAL
ncbi:MAG: class I SAM-dependent methyltransferase [Aquificota bacterium]|nr:class I SAM-dependent methyltransferase [Aquificota bacterium]